MNWKCLIFGCKWEKFLEHWTRGERLRTDLCQRCGAHRTISE